ncbi:Pentachlorophenol 4-monooxygenase [Pigmentiphaga humi]|uniref:Pentachlorophenol 4-monooxygenase n=1 Tax=Pigmentiphaga humi TaxID=2478468 RepID=A0A3P4B5A6_9BURK|nr:FAD-binding monooxygenase [Pigmentiphaga humi]VCU71479.1 Pentachlorophenol 4-monooxygenase [Pigmentiphaga humi]
MQFHLNGFKAGDPDISEPAAHAASGHDGVLPGKVDVLIVGSGPTGLTLATQLSAFPDIRTCIVEQKEGPLRLGQADGIACRTVEMFHAFGFSERVLREAYWVNETSFWKPDDAQRDRIVRSGRIQDTEDGLSEFPHVILNQARVHDFYLDVMRDSPSRLEPAYSRRLLELTVAGPETGTSHPVTARFERLDAGHEGEVETVQARFAVGCDGAHSTVRKSIGRSLHGESANQAWGVMDVLAVTDFPDIRMKSAIHSASEGSVLIIPREGGYLVRLYIELDKLNENERVASRQITSDRLVAAAQRILHPYALDVKEVAWWSVYEIGQRLCDKFDDVPEQQEHEQLPRVFIAGDACHTHSPKAGQGMNVSMQDGFNLGWKLAAVLRGRSSPQILHTYSSERQTVAKELIDFDREFAKMFSAAPKDPSRTDSTGIDPAEFQRYFVKQGRFTAGTETCYYPSLVSAEPTHQELAAGLPIGMRFHSAPVVRLADAKPMHLGHAGGADGRWRLYVFADAQDPASPDGRLAALCDFLAVSERSPVRRYTPAGADVDAVIDVRAVFQQGHRALALDAMPAFLLPRKGRHGLVDYEKMFCADSKSGQDVFDMRGIDRERGCVVVVRPDQYVAHVLPLDAHAELAGFFDGFMVAES